MKKTKKYSIGIAGTGRFAHAHAKAIRSLGNCDLTAVYGSDKSRVEDFSKLYGIKGCIDFKDFLEYCDIVDIVNRHDQHSKVAVDALLAGKDVLVEKPLAINLPDADNIFEVVKKTGRRLSVISQHRYDEAYLKAKDIMESGALGKIIFSCVLMRWNRSQEYYSGSREWLSSPEFCGGGVLMMQAVHLIDVLTWILGPVVSVRGNVDTLTHRIKVEDTAVASLRFEHGSEAVIMATTSVVRNIMDKIEIHGERGSIIIDDHRYLQLIKPGDSRVAYFLERVSSRVSRSLPFCLYFRRRMKCATIAKQIGGFVDCLENEQPVPNQAPEAVHVLRIIQAVYESSRNRSEVILK